MRDQVQLQSGVEQPLAESYNNVRQRTEDICAPLALDDYGMQPIVEVSPPKWHLAHTTWFFETFLLKPQLRGYKVFDSAYEYLFNSYYNGIGAQYPRTARGQLSRPTVEEVYAYRRHVDAAVQQLLQSQLPGLEREPMILGLHHEQQHQELLLSDIKYILGNNPLHPAYVATTGATDLGSVAEPCMPGFATFGGGMHQIGSEASEGFCFDNETPRHPVFVGEFRLANRLVSNADYLEFVQAEGYARPELWLSDGWAAVNAGRFGVDPAPLYWRKRDGHWCEYRLGGLAPLEQAEPVSHVSYYEADAYARWAGQRLPTEFEWEIATTTAAASVDAAGPALAQLYTHCWQWTMSAYAPYPGYRSLQGALGEYNGKFMSGQMVLRGGSVATAAGHGRATYRNFFYPVDRWQFTGIRLAADGSADESFA